ncbi:MAG: relaxase/mobilization nuclease domain-containing protein [Dorea sp.]
MKTTDEYYATEEDMLGLIRYVIEPHPNYCGQVYIRCRNLYLGNPMNPEMICRQLLWVNTIYRQNYGRQMYHFILSPDILNDFPGEQLAEIAGQIADQFFTGHQVIYAVHENSGNKHIHFAINAINMTNGKRLDFFLPVERQNIMYTITNYSCRHKHGILGLLEKLGVE